jgi:hypothetical protein
MVDARVIGDVDYTGAEEVWCADEQIRRDYFPTDKWQDEETFCVPEDIVGQLEKVDGMLTSRRDTPLLYALEVENMTRRLKDIANYVYLYRFDENHLIWEAMSVKSREDIWCSDGYFWMVFNATWGCFSICYATLASTIRHGASPTRPNTFSIDGNTLGIGWIFWPLPRLHGRITLSGVIRGTTIM